MKKVIITTLLALVALTGQAKVFKTFKAPQAMGCINVDWGELRANEVVMADTATTVRFTMEYPKGEGFKFVSSSYLMDKSGKRYALRSAEGLKLDEWVKSPESGLTDFTMHFEPMPKEVQIFDFIEGDVNGAFKLLGIHDVGYQPKGIADTYWRNEQTGDWLIGFAEKYVIYNNGVHEIVSQSEKKDVYTLTTDNGETIEVGKMKNGLRTITIGNGKPVVCSPVMTQFLPDYPAEDLTAFKDNDYQAGDTVTFIGWLKDCPKEVLDKKREFDIVVYGLFCFNKDISVYGKIDSLGRFTVKMPIENTQQVFADWGRLNLCTVLEPGETYFFLYDYKTGQQLFMGSHARVQNELLAHHIRQEFMQSEKGGMTAEEVIDYKNRWAAMYERNNAKLDSMLLKHPTLSRRYEDYRRMDMLCSMGTQVMQAVFYTRDRKLPAEVTSYVDSQMWQSNRLKQPYTTIRDFGSFLYYYMYSAKEDNPKMQQQTLSPGTLRRLGKEGFINLSQEDYEQLDLWDQLNTAFKEASNEESAEIEKKFRNVIENIKELIEREDVKEVIATHLDPLSAEIEIIDSLYADPLLREICKARLLIGIINDTRTALTKRYVAIMNQIQHPAIRQNVESFNNIYLALQQRDINKEQSLKSNDDLADMSDGEKILRKITEPYRGRLILLDVWGTWCTPCKMALANSKEEYERLKDYNLVYLYLANRSEDESWKNVIKEYDLTGDDIVHYNLPYAQQSAVENFLNVHSYPSYRLIDRDGNVLDVNTDPRNLEGLARLLEKLK